MSFDLPMALEDKEGKSAWDAAWARMLGGSYKIEVGAVLQLRCAVAIPRAVGVGLAYLEHQDWAWNLRPYL